MRQILTRWAGRALGRRTTNRADARSPGRPAPAPAPVPAPKQAAAPAYRGDFTDKAHISYAPHADGLADPGEIVWAWVPYEEDASQGKDRPVLVIGLVAGSVDSSGGDDLLGLMLTSKDHDRRRDDGRSWYDLGSGSWDRQGRPSEVRLDRVLRLAPSAVRREGAALEKSRFDAVAAAATKVLGW